MSGSRGATDRWFFAGVAGFFLLVAIVGFAPNSVAILSGTKENPALVVHVHAAAMFSWLVLFLAQASLIGVGNRQLHSQLGRALFVLGPIIVALMIYLAVSRFPGGERGAIIAAVQTERVILFSSFLIGAAISRGTNDDAHKRFILLATIIPLDAAFNRITWLPGATPIWMIALLLPIVTYDLIRLGKLHIVTAVGGGTILLFWIGILTWGVWLMSETS